MIEVTENLYFYCNEERKDDDGGMEKIKLEVSAYITHREVDVEMSSNGSETITISLDRCALDKFKKFINKIDIEGKDD